MARSSAVSFSPSLYLLGPSLFFSCDFLGLFLDLWLHQTKIITLLSKLTLSALLCLPLILITSTMSAGQSDLCDGRLSGRGGVGELGLGRLPWPSELTLFFLFFETTSVAGGGAKPSVFLKGAQ